MQPAAGSYIGQYGWCNERQSWKGTPYLESKPFTLVWHLFQNWSPSAKAMMYLQFWQVVCKTSEWNRQTTRAHQWRFRLAPFGNGSQNVGSRCEATQSTEKWWKSRPSRSERFYDGECMRWSRVSRRFDFRFKPQKGGKTHWTRFKKTSGVVRGESGYPYTFDLNYSTIQ